MKKYWPIGVIIAFGLFLLIRWKKPEWFLWSYSEEKKKEAIAEIKEKKREETMKSFDVTNLDTKIHLTYANQKGKINLSPGVTYTVEIGPSLACDYSFFDENDKPATFVSLRKVRSGEHGGTIYSMVTGAPATMKYEVRLIE